MTETIRERIYAYRRGSIGQDQRINEAWHYGDLVPRDEVEVHEIAHDATITRLRDEVDGKLIATAWRAGMEWAAKWHEERAVACRAKGATGARIHHEDSAAAIRAAQAKAMAPRQRDFSCISPPP